MVRTCLAFALATLAAFLATALRADKPSALEDALALEKTLQDVIQQAEPSIACILVSRSEAYREIFHEPPPDKPGDLGAFNPQVVRQVRPFQRPDDFQREDAVRIKCDLAHPDNVPEA